MEQNPHVELQAHIHITHYLYYCTTFFPCVHFPSTDVHLCSAFYFAKRYETCLYLSSATTKVTSHKSLERNWRCHALDVTNANAFPKLLHDIPTSSSGSKNERTARTTAVQWRMASSGTLRRVALVRTDVSEELSASIIKWYFFAACSVASYS
jgi:hypothetical protein